MSLYCDYEIEEYDKITSEINSILLNKKITKVDINNVKTNDMIYVCFYPNSQKYIYTLTPKFGKVISCENIKFITFNDKEENEIQIQIKNYKNETEYILHPGVSYMGHSLGYDYQIYLVE